MSSKNRSGTAVTFNESITSIQELLLAPKNNSNSKNDPSRQLQQDQSVTINQQVGEESSHSSHQNQSHRNHHKTHMKSKIDAEDKLLEYHLELQQVKKLKSSSTTANINNSGDRQQHKKSSNHKNEEEQEDPNSILNLYADKKAAKTEKDQDEEEKIEILVPKRNDRDVMDAISQSEDIREAAEFDHALQQFFEKDILGIEEEDDSDESDDENDYDSMNDGEEDPLYIRKSHAEKLKERDEQVKLVLDQAIELADEVDAASLILQSVVQQQQQNQNQNTNYKLKKNTSYNTRVSPLLKLLYRDIESRQWRFDTEKAIKMKKEQILDEQRRMREQGRALGTLGAGGISSSKKKDDKNNETEHDNAIDGEDHSSSKKQILQERLLDQLQNESHNGSLNLAADQIQQQQQQGPALSRRRRRNMRRRKRGENVKTTGKPTNLNVPPELLKQIRQTNDDDEDADAEKRKEDDIFGTLPVKSDNLKQLLETDDDEDFDSDEWEIIEDEEEEEEEILNSTNRNNENSTSFMMNNNTNNTSSSPNAISNPNASFSMIGASSTASPLLRGGRNAHHHHNQHQQGASHQPRLGRAARQKEEEERKKREKEKGVFTKLYDELNVVASTHQSNFASSSPSSTTNPKIQEMMKQFSSKFRAAEELDRRRSGLPENHLDDDDKKNKDPRYAQGSSSPTRAIESYTALQEVDSLFQKAKRNFEVAKMIPGTRKQIALPGFVVGSEKEEMPREEYIHTLVEKRRRHHDEAAQYTTSDPLSSPEHRGSHIRRLQEMTRAKQMQDTRFRRKLEKLQRSMLMQGKTTGLDDTKYLTSSMYSNSHQSANNHNDDYLEESQNHAARIGNNSRHASITSVTSDNSAEVSPKRNDDDENDTSNQNYSPDFHSVSREADIDTEHESRFLYHREDNNTSTLQKRRQQQAIEDELGPSPIVLEYRKRKKLAFGRKAATDDDDHHFTSSSYSRQTLASTSKKKKTETIPKNALPPLKKKDIGTSLLSDEARRELEDMTEEQKKLYFDNPFAPTPSKVNKDNDVDVDVDDEQKDNRAGNDEQNEVKSSATPATNSRRSSIDWTTSPSPYVSNKNKTATVSTPTPSKQGRNPSSTATTTPVPMTKSTPSQLRHHQKIGSTTPTPAAATKTNKKKSHQEKERPQYFEIFSKPVGRRKL